MKRLTWQRRQGCGIRRPGATSAGLVLAIILCGAGCSGPRWRTRLTDGAVSAPYRLIVNDDGDAQYLGVNPRAAEGPEGYLSRRFQTAVGTQVGAYFHCVGNGEIPPWGKETLAAIGDANHVMVDAAHEAGMKIFASLRMNDIHDAWAAKLTYPLKVERPDLLIGKESGKPYPADAVMRAFWSALDYAQPEVRAHRLEFIAHTAETYDFDGFELDFFRHPLFFKLGEEAENLATMTEFVRKVRRLLNGIAARRGRAYPLAIRVPDSPEMARRTGLDVERWLEEGLLDMLVIGGGYMPYAGRLKEFIDLAHRHGVRAYPCINHFQEPVKMRSYASNFWALGADGVYVFNFGGVGAGSEREACLNQMHDPEALLGLDKEYLPDNGCSIFYTGYANPAPLFPVSLVGGDAIELVVGDDVCRAQDQGRIRDMQFRIRVAAVTAAEQITIQVNGVQLPAAAVTRTAPDTFEALVQAPLLRRGINQVRIGPGPGATGRLASQVTDLILSVRYNAP